MKTLKSILPICALIAAVAALAQPADQAPPEASGVQTNAVAPETQPQFQENAMPEPVPENGAAEAPPVEAAPAKPSSGGDMVIRPSAPPPGKLVAPSQRVQFSPPATGNAGTNELRLNFRGAPIEMVLNYLSDAAGFIIELDTPVHGTVDVWSDQPVTREEALQLLNSVLNRSGYAVIRNGRVLRVMTRDDAIHSDIPVRVGSDPDSIPKTDEIVTQIIPIRFVEAKQLTADLSPLFSAHATIIANEAGNSIAITDTQANIRHIAEVIKAIDSSAEDVTEIRVFHLKYHDPTEVATLLTSLFSDQGTTGVQSPIRFGGFPGRGPGGFFGRMMAAQQGGQSTTSQRIKQYSHVVAVADPRTSSVVVTANKDLMDQIGDMISQIDQKSPKVAQVSVFHIQNADPQEVAQAVQQLFESTTAGRNARSTTIQSPLMNRLQQNLNSTPMTIGTGFGNGVGGGNTRNTGRVGGF